MQTKQINQSTEELKDLAMKSTPHKSPSHSSSLFERSNKKEEEEEEELEMRAIPKDGQNFDFEEELNFKIISNSNSRDKNGLKSPESASQHSNNSLSLKNPESQNDIDSHKQSVLAILEKIKDQAGLLELFEKYQPKNKEISVVELKASPRTKLKKYKDCIYFGEIINSNRQGKGIMIYADTRVYEGFWENNLKHGKGLEILAQGNRYEGQFLNGKPEGVGTFIWTNGEIYEGEWKNGLKHGSGMWKGIRGESYVGEWKSGKVDGYGIHIWRNGDRYEGELKGFLKHGQGTEKFVNGDFYVGNYVNGKPDGYGEYYWSNGCQYKGHFKNGLRHGKGIWKKAAENSDIYDGEWINDKKCGEGTYVWASGNTYKGEYFNDMRHGYGDMFWSDGSCYKGAWEKGIQHGEGELSVPNKPIQKGLFSNNVFVGEVNGDLKLNPFETVDKKANNESLPHISGGINHPSRNELPEIKNSRGRAAERSHSQASGKRIANAGGSLEKSFQNNKESSAPRRRTLALSTSKEKYTGEFKKLKELNNLDISTQVRKKAPLPVWKPAGKPTVQTRKEKSYYV